MEILLEFNFICLLYIFRAQYFYLNNVIYIFYKILMLQVWKNSMDIFLFNFDSCTLLIINGSFWSMTFLWQCYLQNPLSWCILIELQFTYKIYFWKEKELWIDMTNLNRHYQKELFIISSFVTAEDMPSAIWFIVWLPSH